MDSYIDRETEPLQESKLQIAPQNVQNDAQELVGNSPAVKQLKSLNGLANRSPNAQHLTQLQSIANGNGNQGALQPSANKTGLPDQLKSGIERLGGFAMDDVKVHYNSAKPAQLQAHAYAQGTDIHIAPGQERHLPHEAWHVVQQKQGRVKPTLQLKGIAINDDSALETEADVMGAKALNGSSGGLGILQRFGNGAIPSSFSPIQRQGTGRASELADIEAPAYFIKLLLPGSGDEQWRTTNAEEVEASQKVDGASSAFVRHSRLRTTIAISGPGGEAESKTGGLLDRGSNSIARNLETAYLQIREAIAGVREKHGTSLPIHLLIKAHSRNAVAASQIAVAAKRDREIHNVELVLFDPVPGPRHSGADVKFDVGSLDESTVIYSLNTQYAKGFDPQLILGAKRLIISNQNHGVGIKHGFRFNGEWYKGSRINALPPGIYYDEFANSDARPNVSLRKITAEEAIKIVQAKQGIINRTQNGRRNIILKALDPFVRKEAKEEV